MLHNRGTCETKVVLRAVLPVPGRLPERHLRRNVARQRVVGGRLVGDEVERLATPRELRKHECRVSQQADRQWATFRRGSPHTCERIVERLCRLVEVSRLQTTCDSRGIDLHAENRRAAHRGGERLRTAHTAEPGGQNRPAREIRRSEMCFACGSERLIGPLQDPLGADVDPAPGSHLPIHRQAGRLEPAELLPRRPARHEQRVREQHPRGAFVRPEHRDRLSGLDQKRFVLSQLEQRGHDRLQGSVGASGPARAAVHDELLRMLSHLGVQVVEEHSQRSFRLPRPRVQRPAARGADLREVAAEPLDRCVHGARTAHAAAILCPGPSIIRCACVVPSPRIDAGWACALGGRVHQERGGSIAGNAGRPWYPWRQRSAVSRSPLRRAASPHRPSRASHAPGLRLRAPGSPRDPQER